MAYLHIKPKIHYFGTPVVLLTTCNEDGSANVAPMSSCWALGDSVVLGLGQGGQSATNLLRTGEAVVNLPSPRHWTAVEALAPLTGAENIPEWKRSQFRFEPNKFEAAGLRPLQSRTVRPPRVDGCLLQLETRMREARPGGEGGGFVIADMDVLYTHADEQIVVDGTDHIDPTVWQPLVYNYRHYHGLGPALGRSFRAEV